MTGRPLLAAIVLLYKVMELPKSLLVYVSNKAAMTELDFDRTELTATYLVLLLFLILL